MTMRALGIRVIAVLSITSILILSVGISPAAYAPRPGFVDRVTCGVNEGWASSPDVFIDSDFAPTISDDDGDADKSATLLVEDAISEYWNEGSSADDDTSEGGANSAFESATFNGFDDVDVASTGSADIVITFSSALDAGVFGTASCTIDRSSGNIVSATIQLTTSDSINDETYKNAAAHELGHAIGLKQHSGPPGTLMFKFLSSSDAYLSLSKQSQRTLTNLYG